MHPIPGGSQIVHLPRCFRDREPRVSAAQASHPNQPGAVIGQFDLCFAARSDRVDVRWRVIVSKTAGRLPDAPSATR
jgi:hypothetical protein